MYRSGAGCTPMFARELNPITPRQKSDRECVLPVDRIIRDSTEIIAAPKI